MSIALRTDPPIGNRVIAKGQTVGMKIYITVRLWGYMLEPWHSVPSL